MRILKFGGSSVADANRIRQVGSIVSSAFDEEPIVVVVSALGGVTDELVALADGAPKNREPLNDIVDAILHRHLTVLTEIAPDDDADPNRDHDDHRRTSATGDRNRLYRRLPARRP